MGDAGVARPKKTSAPAGRGTRHDLRYPAGTSGRRSLSLDQPTVQLVRRASPNGVLPSDTSAAEDPERFSVPIKQLLEEHPSFGYRTVAHLLDFNKNTVQRISS